MSSSKTSARRWLIGCCSLCLAGCSSVSPQEAGYTIGAIAGGIIGSAPGAAAGALLGTAAGALLAKPIEKSREAKERQTLEDRLKTPTPAGQPPVALGQPTPPIPAPTSHPLPAQIAAGQPRRIWIDEQVIDGKIIAGHFDAQYPTAEQYATP